MRWLLVAMLTSSCGRVIADCFCEPGHLELAEAVSTRGAVELGRVPRGCGRIDQVHVRNPIRVTVPPLAIVAARSSNPAVQIGFTSTSVSMESLLVLQVVTEAALDAPDSLEADVELETDTGTPRLLSFRVRAEVTAADAPHTVDFGGVEVGLTGAPFLARGPRAAGHRLRLSRPHRDWLRLRYDECASGVRAALLARSEGPA